MASARTLPTAYNTSTYGDVTRDYQEGELSVWEAATDIDLVTATKGEILDCYDDAASYNDYDDLDGATCDADYFRLIKPAGTKGEANWQGHDGTPNNGITFVSTNGASLLQVKETYSQLQDLIGSITTNSASNFQTFAFTFANARIVGCIAYNSTNAGSGQANGILATNTGYIIDCLAHNCKSDGIRSSTFVASTTVYVYNCTSTNNGNGFDCLGNQATATHNWYNLLGTSNTVDFASGKTAGTLTMYNCASSDGTADDFSGTNCKPNLTIAYVNSDGDDFHTSDDDVINDGYDLSATFTDDIDFATITRWPIGFDATSVIPLIMAVYRRRAD